MWYDNPNFPSYDLEEIGKYAHGVGPKYLYIFEYKNETIDLNTKSTFVEEAH